MTRRAAAGKRESTGRQLDQLDELRAQIDAVDDMIVAMLNERARLALEIGRVKRERGVALYDPAREAQVLARVTRKSQHLGGPLADTAVTRFFERIIDEARQLEILDGNSK